MRTLLAGILLVVSACAFGQTYVPLQPPHEGHWYAPARVGEGVHVSLIPTATEGELYVFAVVFGLEGDRDYWAAAQGIASDAFQGGAGEPRDYLFELYQRPAVNSDAELVGFLRLRPRLGGSMDISWDVVTSDFAVHRETAAFQQLTDPVPGWIGACQYVGFGPPPPGAGEYCHD